MVQILAAEFIPPSCNAPVPGPSDVGTNTSPDPALLCDFYFIFLPGLFICKINREVFVEITFAKSFQMYY